MKLGRLSKDFRVTLIVASPHIWFHYSTPGSVHDRHIYRNTCIRCLPHRSPYPLSTCLRPSMPLLWSWKSSYQRVRNAGNHNPICTNGLSVCLDVSYYFAFHSLLLPVRRVNIKKKQQQRKRKWEAPRYTSRHTLYALIHAIKLRWWFMYASFKMRSDTFNVFNNTS